MIQYIWPSVVAGFNAIFASVSTYGPANGVDDTLGLNAHLQAFAGLTVTLRPGQNYRISAPLVIPSGTTLDLNGATITELPGTNNNMIKNAGSVPVRTVNDAAITNAQTQLTSATANFSAADVGRSVTVAGAGAAGNGPLTAKISVFTNATTVTLDTAASATVAAAACNIYNRDSNIAVKGGQWNRGNNGGAFLAAHSLFFRHVDGLTVDIPNGVVSTAGKFAVAIADCTDIWARVRGLNTFSDGLHLDGPITTAFIEEVQGHTGDDLLALTCNDWPGYNDTSGDIKGVTIGSLYEKNGVANLFKVIAGAGCTVDAVKVTGLIKGNTTLNGIWIGDDASQVNTTGGTYGRIDFGRADVLPGAAQFCAFIVSPVAEHIRGIICYAGLTALASAVRVTGNSVAAIDVLDISLDITGAAVGNGLDLHAAANVTIHELIFDKSRMVTLNAATSAMFAIDSGTVDKVTFISPRLDGTAGGGRLVWWAGGTLSYVDVIGGTCNAANAVFRRDVGTVGSITVMLAAHRAVGMSRVGDVRAGTTIFKLLNPQFDALLNAAFFTNAGTMLFWGDVASLGGQALVQRAAAESIRTLGFLSVDVSALTPVLGDLANNSNAAVAPFAQGPAIYDGTKWRLLTDYAVSGTAVLVAGGVTVADVKITANSIIRLYQRTPGGAVGALFVDVITPGTSFHIKSTSATDTSTVLYEIEQY